MKRYTFVLPAIVIIQCAVFAQTAHFIPPKSFEDTVLGWMTVHKAAPRKPMTVDGKQYSSAQLALADAFATWMQASYLPKGGLGEIRLNISEKLGLHNQNDAAMPQTYGANSKTYLELKYDAGRKMVPATDGHLRWAIQANALWFGEPLMVLNTPADYYFLMPLFGEAVKSDMSNDETRVRQRYDLSNHPALKRYITYFNFQLYSSQYANSSNVLLAKDNQLPFVKITRAEYLEKLAGAVDRRHVKEKEDAIRQWPEGNTRANALKSVEDNYQKRRTALARVQAKYQGRLQEVAEVSSVQPSLFLENSPDVFYEPGGLHANRFPVYKVDPAAAALAKTDTPQWILVTWEGNIATNPVAKHLHEAILNNFNFDYLYDFVFDPDKVKGKPYEPRRSPKAVETIAAPAPASETSRMAAADPGVHFFDDFSTTASGQKPTGWSVGMAGLVTTVDGLPGRWAVMAGDYHQLSPAALKKPLPRNFTLSYDLVAAQNFTWGAKGLTMELAHEKATGNPLWYVRLKLRPGSDGREGETTVETKFPAGYSSGSKWFGAPGFSNNKKNNRITVSIKKTEETFEVFIDNKRIAGYEKAFPADLLFNALSFRVLGSSYGENDKFYISQVKITKE